MFSSKQPNSKNTNMRVKKSFEPNSLNDESSSIVIDLFSSSTTPKKKKLFIDQG